MFKALDKRTGKDIVILDPKWQNSIDQLRILDHQDMLICQGCEEPVRVRKGVWRRPHFAHKHVKNCTYIDESSILLDTRASLYKWLVSKFGNSVQIEKRLEGNDLFRPVDCWVEKDGKAIAYWIFDTVIKPDKRKLIRNSFKKLGASINYVFAINMLTIDDTMGCIHLNTTQREFLQHSDYDEVYSLQSTFHKSMHFLDGYNRIMRTFRGLFLYHEPLAYKGHDLTCSLDEIMISPKNGEFVYPGEYERLRLLNAGKQEQDRRLKDLQNRNLNKRPVAQTNINLVPKSGSSTYQATSHQSSVEIGSSLLSDINNSEPRPFNPLQDEGTCAVCGRKTSELGSYSAKTGRYICSTCLRQGKS